LAQIERQGTQFRIGSRWTLADPDHTLAIQPDACTAPLHARITPIRALTRLFSGNKCAAVLPTNLIDLRTFDIPQGTPAELHRMTGEELAADLGVEPQDLAYGCWEIVPGGFHDPGMARMWVTAVPKSVATQAGDSLLSAGLACQVLDSMPCALARAVEMSACDKLGDSVIAIDLGYTLPLVVLVKEGKPIFSRTLRGLGIQALMQPLQTTLGITTEECEQLLIRYGVASSGAGTLAVQRTMDIITHPLEDLLGEIKRTVDYIAQQFRGCKPRQVCLFGGGALIKNLSDLLSSELEMPVAPWTLGGNQADPADALYGVAAGLSSLAWEDTGCS
jgi:Tfp pilus assembly PilM family ATPase